MNKRNEIKADKYSTFVFIYLFLSFSAVSSSKTPFRLSVRHKRTRATRVSGNK